jgi:putative redox protein
MADTTPAVPAMHVTLTWDSGLEFTGQAGKHEVPIDGSQYAAASPMQFFALSIAACMGIDLVHILQRQRNTLTGLEARFSGERSQQDPKRFTHIRLHFALATDATPEQVQRAIDLSRDKYCSALCSLREDIGVDVTFAIDAEA